MSSHRRMSIIGCAILIAGWLAVHNAAAGITVITTVDDIVGEDWRVDGIALSLVSERAQVIAVELTVDRFQLPAGQGELHEVTLSCTPIIIDDQGWRCEAGKLVAAKTPWAAQETGWSGAWRTDGSLQLHIPGLRLARGALDLTVTSDEKGWRAGLDAHRLVASSLARISDAVKLPRDWGVKGRVSGHVSAYGGAARRTDIDADLVLDGLNYASPDGSQAAENILTKIEAHAHSVGTSWQFTSKFRWPKGALYSDPVFIDASETALMIDTKGRYQPVGKRLQLNSWTVELLDTLKVSGTGEIDTAAWSVRDLTVAAHSDDASRLYTLMAQPFLIGTPADDMQVKGRVGFVLHFDTGGIEQAGLQLNGIVLDDRQGRFALRRTDGSVAWDRSASAPVSRLTTQGVELLHIRSGAFAVKFRFGADRIDLVEPVVIPVLGGQVTLDSFAMTGALVAGDVPQWTANASVRAVSLDQLTRQLDWQPFSGNLSGTLDRMHYRDQIFSIGGGLRVNAFGGTIAVDGLRIADPLGNVPILYADASLRGLDLDAVTKTFSFGRIQGRLDADLDDLKLAAWQPSAFDLHLYTPPDDDSRHRISQRAVQNLTELGSGLPGGLSAAFLSLFEDFSYDTIDLKIALRGNTATIDGLARPDGGYYLVRGSGLPRIDVIGRTRSVAWKDLLERLRQIQVEGVQIK